MSDTFILKFKAELDGKDELDKFFDKSTRSAEAFRSRLGQALSGAGSTISSFANKATSEMQAFAGKELGGSIGSQARGVLQLRDAMNQLAVSSGGGTELMSSLNTQIQAVSVSSNQLQTDVTAAMSAFVERTSDLETARKSIEAWAKTATATSTALSDIALVGETISTKFGVKDQGHVFDVLVAQSKAKGGVIELHDIATKGPAIFAAAAAAGLHGEKGIREIGALTQMVAGSTGGKGTAAAASVSIGAIFSQIRQKGSTIEEMGIQINNRDYAEVLQDIIKKTGGDSRKLYKVFKNIRAFRGVEELAREYREGRGFQKFEAFRDVNATPDVIANDFKTRTSTGEAHIKRAQIQRQKFVEHYLGGIAEFGAEHATELQVGSAAAGYLGKGVSLLGRALQAGGGAVGKVGGALESATALPVRVVNWPGGPLGGIPGAADKPGGLATKLGIAGLVLGAGIYGIEKFKEAGEARNQANEDAGVGVNSNQLEMKRRVKNSKIAMFENQGFSHGVAVNLAERQIQNHIKIEIHGDSATVTEENGTRSDVALERRNGGG